MTDLDIQVMDALEDQVPFRHEAQPDWQDVLARARVTSAPNGQARPSARVRPRRSRRLLLAAALAVILGTALSPLGPAVAGVVGEAFDGLSSWLGGQPGEPAAPAEQAGFAARNDASYAAFPAGTQVRLLRRESHGGQSFSFLGFRNGTSLCLRLVKADRPAGRGANQCVTLRELRQSAAPALVASEAWFRFGSPETTVEGVFGFADDTVRMVEVRRLRSGWREAPVEGNVFLALEARPTGTVKNYPPRDPIVQVRAVRHDGERVPVPFIASDFADYGAGIPDEPSYLGFKRPDPAELPGPAKKDARFGGGTIAWLDRREERGGAWTPDDRLVSHFGKLVFAHAVRPDPEDPFRLGIALIEVSDQSRLKHVAPGTVILCSSDLRPLQRGPTGASCLTDREAPSWFAPGRPLTTSYMGPEQITRFSGLAADEVARIELHLASGRVIPAALRDNAYTVSAPTAQFPAKLVTYDNQGRVIGLDVFGGAPRPVPCPPAAFSRPVSELPAPRSYERLDLSGPTVNGQPIFGHSVAEVTAALGKPDRVAYFSIMNGHREPTLFYGGTSQASAALLVRFGWRQERLRAISLSYQSPSLVDARLGHVLRMQPAELERRIASTYGAQYRLSTPYGSEPARGCLAVFETADKAVQLSLVLNPRRPSRPSLVLHHGF